MQSFILKRLLIIVPMALMVVTLTWGLIRLAPGNFYDSDKPLPPAIKANIEKKYGLDKPVWNQYLLMLGNITCRTMDADETTTNGIQFGALGYHFKCLDFGDSLKYQGQSVNEIIRRHLPYSATIGLLAYVLALTLGLTAGTIAALKQNSPFD